MTQAVEHTVPALCETLRARPGALGPATPAAASAPHASLTPRSALNIKAALRTSRTSRLRLLSAVMALLVLLGVGMTALLEGPLLTKRLAWASLAVLFVSFGSAWLMLQAGRAQDDGLVGRVAVPVSMAVVVANLAFGLTTGFCAAVSLGLILFASSVSRRLASLAYGIIAVGYALCALAVQAFPDLLGRPLFPVAPGVPVQHLLANFAIELLYLAAYGAGQAIRREQTRAIHELERAAYDASQREALLAEARDAFKRNAGIGGLGRFSDREVDGFRLGAVIGRGGMGEVYAAERLVDGEPAAVKLLHVDLWNERQALERFAREAKLVASIDSPHVVRVLAVSGPDSVCPFIAMERLLGVDLGSHLRDRGKMALDDVVDMVEQIAAGLAVAHAASIVHRDLKPQNVFRAGGARGIVTWKVLDFGVSKLIGAGEVSLTAAEIVGTPQYMSPEQARGERDLDARTDIYALSAIAYRALTGEAPYRGDLHSILRAIVEEMPEAPCARTRLPSDVDLVLALGMAKQREDRFDDARAFARAFAQAAAGELDPALKHKAQALLAERPYRQR